jgi:hypothetical protein
MMMISRIAGQGFFARSPFLASRRSLGSQTSAPIKVDESWTPTGVGKVAIRLSIKPLMPGRLLKVKATLPSGVSLVGGALEKVVVDPEANQTVIFEFSISYPSGMNPMIPVGIALRVDDDTQFAMTVPVHDPSVPYSDLTRPTEVRQGPFEAVPATPRVTPEVVADDSLRQPLAPLAEKTNLAPVAAGAGVVALLVAIVGGAFGGK